MFIGGASTVGGGGGESLLEIDGADKSEASRVSLEGPDAREAVLLRIRHRAENLLLGAAAGDGGDGESEVSRGRN